MPPTSTCRSADACMLQWTAGSAKEAGLLFVSSLCSKQMPIFSQSTFKQCVPRSTCYLDGKVFSGSWKPQQEARGSMKPKFSCFYFKSLLLWSD